MNAGPLLIHNLSWLSLFQNYPSDNREETGSTGIYGQCGSHCANVKHYMSHLQLLSVDSEQQVAEQSELSKPPKHICTDNVGLRPHRLRATWADVLGGRIFLENGARRAPRRSFNLLQIDELFVVMPKRPTGKYTRRTRIQNKHGAHICRTN